MSMKKFGTGQVTETETPDEGLAKQAAVRDSEARPWTPQDAAELAAENEEADDVPR